MVIFSIVLFIYYVRNIDPKELTRITWQKNGSIKILRIVN